MAEKKKKPGDDNILLKKELIVQKLSSEPKTTTTKFTRQGLRKFAEYNYDEIFLESVKQACTQHFKEKQNGDVLASEQATIVSRKTFSWRMRNSHVYIFIV